MTKAEFNFENSRLYRRWAAACGHASRAQSSPWRVLWVRCLNRQCERLTELHEAWEDELDREKEYAYWREIDRKIDESRGK